MGEIYDGNPNIQKSDNGLPFNSTEMQKFAKKRGHDGWGVSPGTLLYSNVYLTNFQRTSITERHALQARRKDKDGKYYTI